MRLLHFMMPILAVALAAGCAAPPAAYDYEKSTDFGKYKRWEWLPHPQEQPSGDPRIDNSLTRQRIESAVESHLTARGFEKSDGGTADFRVGYLVTVEKRLDSSGVSTSFGFGRYSGGSGVGVSFGGPATAPTEYEEGTLFIDIKDGTSGDLAWRGSSSTRLGRTSTPEESQALINRVVGEILANFPPKKGS